MKLYAGVTDADWFDYLGSQPEIDEVNFWQPSANAEFRSLSKGDIFLFKLHRSERTHNKDLIAVGGIFVSFSILPISIAWEAFENRNGAPSYAEMRRRLVRYRRIPDNPQEDFQVGCIILTQPFFFNELAWFPAPDWKGQIVRGKAKGYELDKEAGQFIWKHLQNAWQNQRIYDLDNETRRIEERARYGKEATIKPRLGQGAFRVLVTDAYQRSCAITEEHSLPALEAAHIRPYNENGPNEIGNGLLLRSDFHRLFDRGYITVTPDYRVRISRRLKKEFENGRSYYPFDNQPLNHFPNSPLERPFKEMLLWHNEYRFKE